jgi:hypothetical protein
MNLKGIGMIKLPPDFELDRYGLHVRLVNENDAKFILKLRTDPTLNKYIHKTDEDVASQVAWIRKYKLRERDGIEFYFIFSYNGVEYGVDRLYKIHDKDFVSGSWLFLPLSPIGVSSLAGIITKEIAYDILNLENDFADIRKQNKSVIRYMMMFKPSIIREDAENIYLHFEKSKFNECKKALIDLCEGSLNKGNKV